MFTCVIGGEYVYIWIYIKQKQRKVEGGKAGQDLLLDPPG
jgi:hypothetical protein